jgi:RNA polymerase sigma factor (sigma-70 family)
MNVVRTFRSACDDATVNGSHAAELDLARRCAAGEPAAWDEFVREYRPVLYRAADALDPNGGARDLADALYGDLYGVRTTGHERRSLLLTFNGRSSLASWLRAVLCQRYIDRLRAERRLVPLPADDPADVRQPADPNRLRYVEIVGQALGRAVGRLATKDRLRLAYYYLQELTLAEIGRLVGEHEATVSRQLARTRRAVRDAVERELREDAGLTDPEVAECLASVADDPGSLDLQPLLVGARSARAPSSERSV